MDRKAVILFSILLFSLIPSFAFLTGSTYRQNITLDFVYTHASYIEPLLIDTQTLIAAGKLQSDCADLRFTNTTDTLYDYWIQKDCNTTETLVYVHVDKAITVGNNSLFFYYGNENQTSLSNFNQTFSNVQVVNGDFEGDASGNPANWVIVETSGSIGVTQTRAFTGTNSTQYNDNSGAGQPTMLRGFPGFSTTNVFEFAINVDSIGTDGPFIRIGGDTGDFAVLSMQFKSDNSIDIFPDNSATPLNVSFAQDTWVNVSIGTNFSSAQNFYWINDQYAGAHNFRNSGGAPSDMDDIGFQAGTPSTTLYYLDAIRIREWENPEPPFTFSPEETTSAFSFTNDPETPNVLEPTDFLVVTDISNITRFWWDFGDGSDVVSTTNNFTAHTFNRGGIFTVNLTGFNESTNNITVARQVTVFEPTITIWARDIINDEFVENFTVFASNSTNTTQFTAIGTTAVWNFTSGPYGLVNISIEKESFNHTTEAINITNATNVNFTASIFPALFIFRPVDFEFINASVPVTATMTNDSLTVSKSNDFESFLNLTTIVSGAGSQTLVEVGNFTTGQMFKYTLFVDISASASGDGPNASIQIFNEDETEFFTLDILNEFTETTKTRYFFISKDATWKLLDEGFNEVDTGSFAFFPVKMRGRNRVDKDLADAIYTASSEIFRLDPNLHFTFPDNALTGNVSVKFEQRTTGVYGFLENIYEVNYLYFENVQETNLFNQTVYLVNEDTSFSVRFTILDSAAVPRSNAHVQIFRYDAIGNLEEISSSLTDASGNTPFFHFIRNSQIQVFASFGEETTDGIQNIFVSEDSLQVQLILGSQVLQVNPTPFASVFTFLSPEAGITLTENTTQLFNFTVIDTDASLTNTSIHLFSTDLGFSNFSSSSSPSAFNFESTIYLDSLNSSTATVFFVYNITKTNAEGGTDFLTATVEWLVYPDFSLRNINELSDDLGNFKYLFGLILLIIGFTVGKWTGLGATAGAWFFGWLPDSSIWIAGILTVIYTWSDGRK